MKKRQKKAENARVLRFSMRSVIMDGLQFAPYKKLSVQVISESLKLKSLGRGKLILSEVEPAASKFFNLADKNMSTVVMPY